MTKERLSEIIQKCVKSVLNETLSNQQFFYHFTDIKGYIGCCNDNTLHTAYHSQFNSTPISREEFNKRNNNSEYGICLTRCRSSKMGYANKEYGDSPFVCRLTFNGNTLNKIRKLRSQPVNFYYQIHKDEDNVMSPKMKKTLGKGMNNDESEERLNTNEIHDLDKYVYRVDIFVDNSISFKILPQLANVVNTPIGLKTFVYVNRNDLDFCTNKCLSLREYINIKNKEK